MRISLQEWAATQHSPQTMPTLATLRARAASGLISDCIKIGGQWLPSDSSVYIEQQPASIPAHVSSRVAGILRAA